MNESDVFPNILSVIFIIIIIIKVIISSDDKTERERERKKTIDVNKYTVTNLVTWPSVWKRFRNGLSVWSSTYYHRRQDSLRRLYPKVSAVLRSSSIG